MPIPPGIPAPYIYAALWAVLSLALLAASSQLPKEADFADRVRSRTYARLLDLNRYLQRLVDKWSGRPTDDLVSDSEELRALKQQVDRAAALSSMLDQRSQLINVGRLVLVLEVASAALYAGLTYLGVDQTLLSGAALAVAATGILVVVVILVYTSVLALRIGSGSDFQ